ncbi:MAG: hypothetical protein ACI33J_05935 [Clostridium sp.]
MSNIQDLLDAFWGTVITDIQINILNDSILFNLKSIDDGKVDYDTLEFLDVSSYYYVKDSKEHRFNFYDREKRDYLELTSIAFLNKNEEIGSINFKLPLEKEWSNYYNSNINIVMEIWEDILCIEARKVCINGRTYNLK